MAKKYSTDSKQTVTKSIGLSAKNVSSKWLKAMRRDRIAEMDVETILKKERFRAECKNPVLRSKYAKEEVEKNASMDIFNRFNGKVPWSACVRATREDSTAALISKNSHLLKKGSIQPDKADVVAKA